MDVLCARAQDLSTPPRVAIWPWVAVLLLLATASLWSQGAPPVSVLSVPTEGHAWALADLGMVLLPVPKGQGRIGSEVGLGAESGA